jgi:hypothetical protein
MWPQAPIGTMITSDPLCGCPSVRLSGTRQGALTGCSTASVPAPLHRKPWDQGGAGNKKRIGGPHLEGLDAVHGVVVEDSDEHVVRADADPLLPRRKLGAARRQVGRLERLDQRLRHECGVSQECSDCWGRVHRRRAIAVMPRRTPGCGKRQSPCPPTPTDEGGAPHVRHSM